MGPVRKLVYLGIAAAISMAAATAQADSMVLAGEVKCEGIYADGSKYKPDPFDVTLFFEAPGFWVLNRWGSGNDVGYRAMPFGFSSKGGTEGFTCVFAPNSFGFEGCPYSETAKVKMEVDKKGNIKFEGDSIVFSDNAYGAYPSDQPISAACKWNLTGTVPPP